MIRPMPPQYDRNLQVSLDLLHGRMYDTDHYSDGTNADWHNLADPQAGQLIALKRGDAMAIRLTESSARDYAYTRQIRVRT